MNCLICSRDLFLNYSVVLNRCKVVTLRRTALPQRDDPSGTRCADLVGVAEAEMGRLAAFDVTEEVAGTVWTRLLALLLTHPSHVPASVTPGRQLL